MSSLDSRPEDRVSTTTLDRIDKRLLEALQADNTVSMMDLAERLHLSRSACSRRLQRLESAGYIRAQVALLDAKRLGLGLTVFIAIKTNQHNAEWSRRFQAIVADLPGILEAHRMGGEVDYLLKAVVTDMAGYDRLYQRLILADLFDVSASFVMETLKDTTALPLR